MTFIQDNKICLVIALFVLVILFFVLFVLAVTGTIGENSKCSEGFKSDNLVIQLQELEQKYGGLIDGVKRNKLSVKEPSNYYNTHRGGDRMASNLHNYAPIYAQYLKKFIGKKGIMAEVGILTGVGLAIWSDLFPQFEIFGFDLDTNIFHNNEKNLKSLGAFSKKYPKVQEFDQMKDNSKKLSTLGKFDVVIDDGCHRSECILETFKSFKDNLSKDFVYFIEDNSEVYKQLKKLYPDLNIFYKNEMTVITPKLI